LKGKGEIGMSSRIWILALVILFAFVSVLLFASAWLQGCGDDEPCLKSGACCTSPCKEETYGIPAADYDCCSGHLCHNGYCQPEPEEEEW
jgi:hypothetical protein